MHFQKDLVPINTISDFIFVKLITFTISIFFFFLLSLFTAKFRCDRCEKCYKHAQSLNTHKKYECGKDPQLQCPYCPYKSKLRSSMKTHIMAKHTFPKLTLEDLVRKTNK